MYLRHFFGTESISHRSHNARSSSSNTTNGRFTFGKIFFFTRPRGRAIGWFGLVRGSCHRASTPSTICWPAPALGSSLGFYSKRRGHGGYGGSDCGPTCHLQGPHPGRAVLSHPAPVRFRSVSCALLLGSRSDPSNRAPLARRLPPLDWIVVAVLDRCPYTLQ